MPDRSRFPLGTVRRTAVIAAYCLIVGAAIAAGLGWLYLIHTWVGAGLGPRVGDSLPLLQLANLDAQPIVTVIAIWLATGIAVGALLQREPRILRAVVVAATSAVILVVDSQISFAIARNTAVANVLLSRMPGAGVFVAVIALTAGSVVLRPGSTHVPDVA